MNDFEKLINEFENEGLIIIEKSFKSEAKGLIKNNKIAINKNIDTIVEKRCILAEELGHYYTNYGDILNLSEIENIKQENKALRWSYQKLIGLNDIVKAFNANCIDKYELAEYLNVTLEFLEECVRHYKNIYGVLVDVNEEYTIIFEPFLSVLKKF